MKMACFLMDNYQKELLKNKFDDIQIFNGPLDNKNINQVLDAEILVSRPKGIDLKFDNVVLSKFKKLKFICSMSTGFDHIDLDYCNKNEIVVSNVPSYAESSVAEQTFALILAISRKIPQSIKTLSNRNNSNHLTGFDLKGKTMGVIGSGKIGLEVIKIAKGFGMKVIAYDVVKNENARKELDFEYIELDDLLRVSEIVSIHAPYNKHTFHLLNKDNLAIIKKGAVMINTSRGELIDSKALYSSLCSGKISFAGLDVLERDSRYNQKFLKMKNVFVTPHNSANTIESKKRVLDETIENISEFIKGRKRNIL